MSQDILLKLSNGIKGESKYDQKQDWIDVLSWNWGMSQSGTTHMGGGGGGGKVSVMDLHIVKYVDKASTDLMLKCADGTHIEEALLEVRKAGTTPLMYFSIKMKNIIISSYQTGGQKDGLDRMQEQMSMNFNWFEINYIEQKLDGTGEPAMTAVFDIATNLQG